ncbi:MAG: hypothetical protein HY047_05035 [Acidobacteria bacterium]|nr:hypothetical protein [Acidobacteriota bacterium]
MSVSLQKIEGVETVSVTLNKGQASVVLRPGNKVTLAAVRRLIERNGFTPKAASIVAEADVVSGPSGQPQVRVTGTNEIFSVSEATSEGLRSDLKKQVGTHVIVEGIVPPATDNPAGAMDVKVVRPANR